MFHLNLFGSTYSNHFTRPSWFRHLFPLTAEGTPAIEGATTAAAAARDPREEKRVNAVQRRRKKGRPECNAAASAHFAPRVTFSGELICLRESGRAAFLALFLVLTLVAVKAPTESGAPPRLRR